MTKTLSDYINNNFSYHDTIKISSFSEKVSLINCHDLSFSITGDDINIDFDIHHKNIKVAFCDIEATLVKKNHSSLAPENEITFFPTSLNSFFADTDFIYIDGVFESHNNAQYRAYGNGFALFGDSIEEGVNINITARINSLEVSEIHDYLPVNAINLLSDLEMNSDRLFSLLCQEITDKKVIDISNADHGHKAEECLRVLKEVILNKKTPNSIDFNLSEVLMLTCWGDYGPYNENIAIAFSLTFLLKGDYQAQIGEDSNVYWLIHLFVVTSCFDRKHKEALLGFYLWYIQNEFTYDNPFIFLYYLIIATMASLNYPVETIKPMLEYLQQTDYTKTSFVYTYFPENKFAIVSEKLNDAIQEYNAEESFKSEFLNIWHEIVTSYQAEKLSKKDTD